MENIDLFDNYINEELSKEEREAFEARLKSDKEFAREFEVYSLTVLGLCREAEQDNKDFEMAMKHISKDNLLEIIGKKEEKRAAATEPIAAAIAAAAKPAAARRTAAPAASIPAAAKPAAARAKASPFKKWLLWQSIGVAALLGLAVIYIVIVRNETDTWKRNALAVNEEAMNKIDNTIFTLSDFSKEPLSRGGKVRGATQRDASQRSGLSEGEEESEELDIYSYSIDELKILLPEIEEEFKSQTDDMEISEYGSSLVMIYVRLHERDKAKALLTELIAKFKGNEDYAMDVENWQTILQLLQQ